MKVIIGFLENLDFDEGAKEIGRKSGMYPERVREWMMDLIQDIFKKAKVPFLGPSTHRLYPIGGYFFKIRVPKGEKNLKKLVLEKLGIKRSLKLPLYSKIHKISLGFVIKEYPKDKYPGKVARWDSDVLDLSKYVAAMYRLRRERKEKKKVKPYFMIVDKEFRKKFPVEEQDSP